MYNIQGNEIQGVILDQALFACIKKSTSVIEGVFVEDRLAKLTLRFISVCDSDRHLSFFYNVLQAFAESNFLNMKYLVQSLENMLSE